MKKLLVYSFWLASTLSPCDVLFAQLPAQLPETKEVKEFTFLTDRMIRKADDLVGYTLRPMEGKLSNSPISKNLKRGLVEFKITANSLIVTENVKFSTTNIISETDFKNYKLSISSISDTKYGFEVIVMDLNNPDIQGHHKIYRNPANQIERVQFRPAPAEPERTYIFLPPPADIENRDSKFFSHDADIVIPEPADLWSKKIQLIPFAKVYPVEDILEFARLYPSSRINIKFDERTEQKGKKEKLVQIITLNQPDEANNNRPLEFHVRKIKEVAASSAKNAPKEIHIECLDFINNKDALIIITRSSYNTITQIRIGDNLYTLRPGKRKVG